MVVELLGDEVNEEKGLTGALTGWSPSAPVEEVEGLVRLNGLEKAFVPVFAEA